MSVNSHIHEYDSSEVDTFLSECGCRLSDSEAAEKFLHGIYPDDSEPDDESAYDMDKGKDDPVFKIQVNDNSMDDYYEENYLKIHLPNRDAADELASIVGGDVVDDEPEGQFFISGGHHFEDGDEVIQVPTIFDSLDDAAKTVRDIVNETIEASNSSHEKVTAEDCKDGYELSPDGGVEKLFLKIIKAK
jgi:hypothetical protein